MQKVARSAIVAHAAEDMYLLAADVASYPKFLPWCASGEVLQRDARMQLARIGINYRGVRNSFTTQNKMFPFEKIEMELADGPFDFLCGAWRFRELQPGACRVQLDLQFEVSGAMRAVLSPLFARIAGELVDSFVARAASADKHAAGDDDTGGNHANEKNKKNKNKIYVEVVYASPDAQVVLPVQLTPPATVAHAISASGIASQVAGLEVANVDAGVFGMRRPPEWQLSDGDRVEIYRPLLQTPRESRRRRARG